MSRHIWTYRHNGKTYHASAGYDKHTLYHGRMQPAFFFDVEDMDAPAEEADRGWFVHEGYNDSCSDLINQMNQAGVPYPVDLRDSLFDDAVRDRMNRVTQYGADEPMTWPRGFGYDDEEGEAEYEEEAS